MKRGTALMLAIACAAVGLYGVVLAIIFVIQTAMAPDHGGDMWLALPIYVAFATVGGFLLVAAKLLFDWWRRMTKLLTKV